MGQGETPYPANAPSKGYPQPGNPEGYPQPGYPEGYPQPGYPQPGFQAPPPPYGVQPGPPATVTVVAAPQLGTEPTCTTCPYCRAQITTQVEYLSGSKTHLFALLLCLICPCGCCLIPYCTNSCMTASHTCPSCKQFLGTNSG